MGKRGRTRKGVSAQRAAGLGLAAQRAGNLGMARRVGRPRKRVAAQRAGGLGLAAGLEIATPRRGRPINRMTALRGRAREMTKEQIDKAESSSAAKKGRSKKGTVALNENHSTIDKLPFVCGLCDEKFEQMYTFYQHFSKHKGKVKQSQLHNCMPPQNGEKSSRTGENFKCGVCSAEFPSLCVLHEHLKHPVNGSYTVNLSSLTASPDCNQCRHGDTRSNINGTNIRNELGGSDSSDLDVNEDIDDLDLEYSDDENKQLPEIQDQKDMVKKLNYNLKNIDCKVDEEVAKNLKECFVRLKPTPLLNNIKKEDPDAVTTGTEAVEPLAKSPIEPKPVIKKGRPKKGTVGKDDYVSTKNILSVEPSGLEPSGRSTRKKRVKYDQFLVDSDDEEVVIKSTYKKKLPNQSPDHDYIPSDGECEPEDTVDDTPGDGTVPTEDPNTDTVIKTKPAKRISLKKLFSLDYTDENHFDTEGGVLPIKSLSRKVYYPCKICGILIQKNRLLKHEAIHNTKHGEVDYHPDKIEECPTCLRRMLKKNMALHKCQCMKVRAREKFGVTEPKPDPQIKKKKQTCEMLPCDVCGLLIQRYKMKNHKYKHIDEKAFPCDHCEKAFKTPKIRGYHIQAVHGERTFQCDQCPAAFRTNSLLKEHYMIHTNERPFPCPTCGKRFRRKTQRNNHLLIHTERIPDKRCEQCGKMFIKRFSLTEHIATVHNDIKNHVCYCGKRFRGSTALRRHQLIHTGEKPVKCDHCPAAFTQRTELKAHLRSKHGINQLPPTKSAIERQMSMYGLDVTNGVLPSSIPNIGLTSSYNSINTESCITSHEPTLMPSPMSTDPLPSTSSSTNTDPLPTPSTTSAEGTTVESQSTKHMTITSRTSPMFVMPPETISNIVKAIYPERDRTSNGQTQDEGRVTQSMFYPVQNQPLNFQRQDGYGMVQDEMKVETSASPVHDIQFQYPQFTVERW